MSCFYESESEEKEIPLYGLGSDSMNSKINLDNNLLRS